MTQMPTVRAKRLVQFLKKQGFKAIRQQGSHIFFKYPDGKTTVVPLHTNQDIGRGLLRKILDDIQMTPQEFIKKI